MFASMTKVVGPQGYKTFFIINSTEHEIFPAHNVKMPTIVGILTFISRISTTSSVGSRKKSLIFHILFSMSSRNFMLSRIEHEVL